MQKLARAIAAAAVSAALVVAPAAAASAAPAADLPGPLGNAYDIQQYRLAYLPPTAADLRRFNPTATDDQIKATIDQATDRLDEQRVKASIAQYGKSSNVPLNTTDQQLQADIKAQKAGFRAPFAKARTITKGAAAGATVLTGFPMGFAIGSAGLEAFGISTTLGDLCTGGLGGVAPLIGAGDCDDYLAINAEQANDDAVAGITAGPGRLDPGSNGFTGFATYLGQTPNPDRRGEVLHQMAGTELSQPQASTIAVSVQYKYGAQTGFAVIAFSKDNQTGRFVDSEPEGFDILGICDGAFKDQTGCASGDVLPTKQGTSDPERTLYCKVLGSDGRDYGKSTGTFHETDEQLPEPQCPLLPDGVTPKHVTISELGGPKDLVIYDGEQSPWAAEVAEKFPQCATGMCALELYQEPAHKSCFDGKTACDGWYDDVNKASAYTCEYDGTKVDLDHCNRYRQTFDAKAREAGAPYSTPDGQIRIKATTKPAAGVALQGGADFDSCKQLASAADVFTVIFNPVRCALLWAFVPSPLAVLQATSNARDAIMATDVGKWVLAFPNLYAGLSVSGCGGYPITWEGETFHAGAACDGDVGHNFAPAVKTISAIALLSAGLFSCLSSLAGVFAMGGFGKGGGE